MYIQQRSRLNKSSEYWCKKKAPMITHRGEGLEKLKQVKRWQ